MAEITEPQEARRIAEEIGKWLAVSSAPTQVLQAAERLFALLTEQAELRANAEMVRENLYRIACSLPAEGQLRRDLLVLEGRLTAPVEAEAPERGEDDWVYTTEKIDFAPIWSRADFERRAKEEGWTPGGGNG